MTGRSGTALRVILVVVGVVADREGVGGGQRHPGVGGRGGGPLQEPVHLAEVVLDQEAFPAVVGVAVPAALEVGGQRIVGIEVAVRRQVDHVVAAVGVRQPAEEVVERPVLHHEHDHVLDAVRACGESAGAALAAVWDRNSVPVIARPVEAPMSWRKVRRVSIGKYEQIFRFRTSNLQARCSIGWNTAASRFAGEPVEADVAGMQSALDSSLIAWLAHLKAAAESKA